MEFLPELQRNWSIDELQMLPLGTATIRVSLSHGSKPVDIVGRHVRDLLSWPISFTREQATAEFRFEHVFVLRYSEEHSTSDIESPEFEGKFFRRYFDSRLLREQREFRPELEDSFKHYQLNTSNFRIDIVCLEPPSIVLREAVPPPRHLQADSPSPS